MACQQEQMGAVLQFHSSLARVVELGYGDDECEQGILVMFDDVVRQVVPRGRQRELPFRLPFRPPEGRNTYAHMLHCTSEVCCLLEHEPPKRPVVFPFVTTLAISGGVYLLAFHVARLAPTVLRHALTG